MRFTIRHETLYRYSSPVTFSPHITRLRPRDDGTQRTLGFSLDIDPAPGVSSPSLDVDGNIIDHHSFFCAADHLRIVSSLEVETLRTNAFDYLPDPGFDTLPVRYANAHQAALAAYLARADNDGGVLAFAQSVAAESNGTPVGFLDTLNRAISQRIRHHHRERGAAQSAATTLARRAGACRDLTVLYMEACRSLGFAARFVSGYRRGDLTRRARHLHAWPEVFVAGGGWRGWDPIEGVAVADAHVALAASATQAGTMPVSGSYFGTGISSALDYRIQIDAA
jgi:transglutaminase-like putative cysteine protease